MVQTVVSLGGRQVVSEVGALKLHLSKTSSTGYKGVLQLKSGGQGAFIARTTNVPQQQLGSFATALDAAVCFARHMLTQGSVAAAQGVEVAGAKEGVEVVEEEAAGETEWVQCDACNKWRVLPAGSPPVGEGAWTLALAIALALAPALALALALARTLPLPLTQASGRAR